MRKRKSIVGASCASYALGRMVVSEKEVDDGVLVYCDNWLHGMLLRYVAMNDLPDGWRVDRLNTSPDCRGVKKG